MTDLTLIVIAHDETLVSGPTMTSAELAVEAARHAGHSVQLVVALVDATESTTEWFHQPAFDHWERRVLREGDLARARNSLVPEVDGRNIAFLDADDMLSENWLHEALGVLDDARQRGEHVIVHPEVTLRFDGEAALTHNIAQASPLFTPHLLYVRNYYDSHHMAPREAHQDVPYALREVPGERSHHDWQFAIETMSRGWNHVLVPDTVVFERRRDRSLTAERDRSETLGRQLPAMAIDRIKGLARSGRRRS